MGWGPKSIGHAFSSVAKPVKKVVGGKTGAALGVALAPFTGGASLALTGASLLKKAKAATSVDATVDTSPAQDIIEQSEKKTKQTRARLLATSGGILGEEIETVQKKSGRNLFGN